MWVCSSHLKIGLNFLEAPHVYLARYHINCYICNKPAVANLFYAHKTIQKSKKKVKIAMKE